MTPRALEMVPLDKASCDASKSKSQGDGGDEKEEGDDNKDGERDDQLGDLFGNSDTSESEDESDDGNADLRPNGHEWEKIAVVSEDLGDLSRHRRTKIHFEHDGLDIADRTHTGLCHVVLSDKFRTCHIGWDQSRTCRQEGCRYSRGVLALHRLRAGYVHI